jgi:hypothetical protein
MFTMTYENFVRKLNIPTMVWVVSTIFLSVSIIILVVSTIFTGISTINLVVPIIILGVSIMIPFVLIRHCSGTPDLSGFETTKVPFPLRYKVK